jgi:hypothetical protein
MAEEERNDATMQSLKLALKIIGAVVALGASGGVSHVATNTFNAEQAASHQRAMDAVQTAYTNNLKVIAASCRR